MELFFNTIRVIKHTKIIKNTKCPFWFNISADFETQPKKKKIETKPVLGQSFEGCLIISFLSRFEAGAKYKPRA